MHDEPDPLNDTSPRTTPANASRDRVVIDVADVEPATVPMPEVPYRSAIDAAIVATSFASLSASVRFPNALSEAPFDWGTSAIATKCDSPPGSSACAKMRRLCPVRPEIGWAVYDPAQVDAVRDHREKELAQLQREGQDRAFARAAAWSSKARCQRCGTWLYAYGGDPPSRHCDAPVVDVSYR